MPDAGKRWAHVDVQVGSWGELVGALHAKEVIDTKESAGGHFRSPYVFRGMSDAAWRLQTSLERLGTGPARVEQPPRGCSSQGFRGSATGCAGAMGRKPELHTLLSAELSWSCRLRLPSPRIR